MPWDGGTQRLPRLIGRGRATELLLTGRLIDASEALEAGLVSAIAPRGQVTERAQQIASIIASHGPIAARYLKEAVASGLDTSLPQALRLEADLNFILQTTSDRAEGIDSFLERRPPRYTGE
jgi:enoyl-CoA hydratase/carnithine racemase